MLLICNKLIANVFNISMLTRAFGLNVLKELKAGFGVDKEFKVIK